MAIPPEVGAVFAAKTVRTFCYGFLAIVLPLTLSSLGMSAPALGVSVTLMLAGSALMTWAVRRPLERHGARSTLMALAALSVASAVILLWTSSRWMVVAAAILGNVAVSTGETGPFLAIEQIVVTRSLSAARRTSALSVYNLLGYAAASLGAGTAGLLGNARALFSLFLLGSAIQCFAYCFLSSRPATALPSSGAALPSAPLIRRLAALFALDSFAGGFVVQSLVAYYFHARFGLALGPLGAVFFAAQILTAASLLLAARAAGRFGLLNTMVFSHLASNGLLIAIAAAPSAGAAVALLLARHLLSQMDVPTRQAYVMAVVEDQEREAAATATTVARTVAQAVTPAVTGWVMQAVALSAPFVLGGGLKIAYDLLLYFTFRKVALREEPGPTPVSTFVEPVADR